MLVNLGSSLFGKAFYENVNNILVYQIVGIFLSFVILSLICRSSKFKDVPNSTLIFSMLFYSLVIILSVSLTRYKNGLDMAMGGWYQSHLKWIPFVIPFLIVRWKSSILKGIVLLVMFSSMATGVYFEVLKAPHVKGWYRDIYENSFLIIPKKEFSNRNLDQNSFYWDVNLVERTLNLMYKNGVGYYRSKLVSGLTSDNWIEEGGKLSIICPAVSTNLNVYVDIYSHGFAKIYGSNSERSGNLVISKSFNAQDVNYIVIDTSQMGHLVDSNPHDKRSLTAHVSKIVCE